MAMKKVYHTVNGQLIAEETPGGGRVDYLTDAFGNVTATVNQSAQVVNTYRYKPYGGLLAKTGVGSDPAFQWVGTEGYRQTGKSYSDVYIRRRHYSSAMGQWTTVAPLWPAELPYIYANSNPILLLDRSGLIAFYPDTKGCHRACVHAMNDPRIIDRDLDGTVACCQHTKCACSLRAQPWEGIEKCILEHEKDHFDDVDCFYDELYYVPPWRDPSEENREECKAYVKTVSCLKRNRSECGPLKGEEKKDCYRDYLLYQDFRLGLKTGRIFE